jgi:hypothetical protein
VSYARFGWDGSDVYVYYDVGGYYNCCFCILQEREWVDDPGYTFTGGYFRNVGEDIETHFDTSAETIAHLLIHREQGHTVTDDTLNELREERP